MTSYVATANGRSIMTRLVGTTLNGRNIMTRYVATAANGRSIITRYVATANGHSILKGTLASWCRIITKYIGVVKEYSCMTMYKRSKWAQHYYKVPCNTIDLLVVIFTVLG